MKKIPMFLLLLAPYLFLLTVVMTVISENGFTAKALDTAAGIYLGMLLMILIPNMVYAFILKGHGYELRKLFFWNMLLKLSHIPIYFLVFAAGLFLGLMIVGMMLIPFLVIFDYSLLLSSSMYGISGIWGLAGCRLRSVFILQIWKTFWVRGFYGISCFCGNRILCNRHFPVPETGCILETYRKMEILPGGWAFRFLYTEYKVWRRYVCAAGNRDDTSSVDSGVKFRSD